MTTFTHAFVAFLAVTSVKGAVLLTFTAIAALLLRRASASLRHLIWVIGLGCVLVLPFISIALPQWRVAVTTSAVQPRQSRPAPLITTLPPSESYGKIGGYAGGSTPLASNGQPLRPSSTTSPIPSSDARSLVRDTWSTPWTIWAFLIWTAGAGLMLLRITLGAVQRKVLADTGTIIDDTGAAAEYLAAAQLLCVKRPVALVQASEKSGLTVAVTWGIVRPVIVLPRNISVWPGDQLRAVLIHELAHIRRADWLLQTVASFVCAVYWFNPLVWLATRQMRTESETACDNLVLSAGVPAADYARHLLDVAVSRRDTRRLAGGVVAMAQTPKVESRIKTILSNGVSRSPVSVRFTTMTIVMAIVVALPLAAVRSGSARASGDARPIGRVPALDSAAYLSAGNNIFRTGQPRDAIPDFTRAVQLDSQNADAQFQLAQALYQYSWKHFKTANRSTTICITSPPAMLDAAISRMQAAVKLRPLDPIWQSELGDYLAERGDYDRAIPLYETALHLLGPPPATNLLHHNTSTDSPTYLVQCIFNSEVNFAEALVKVHQYGKALHYYRLAMQLSPPEDWLLLGYGDALAGLGRQSEARIAWRQVAAFKPRDPYYQMLASRRLARD